MSPPVRTAAVVIPARLGSRRFPRKVLARETGKFLIQHVWERIVGCPGVARVLVATDSDEVREACASFGAEAVMTSAAHACGTDRVAEVAETLTEDVVINVQGDEPYITHADVRSLIELFATSPEPAMTTLVAPRLDLEGFLDSNIVKAVLASDGRALYFSRSPVPWTDHPGLSWRSAAPVSAKPDSAKPDSVKPDSTEPGVAWWQHIGIYGYRREFLIQYARLPPTALEGRERLEQLRALEHGYEIRCAEASGQHLGIDTEEEYARFAARENTARDAGSR